MTGVNASADLASRDKWGPEHPPLTRSQGQTQFSTY